MTLLPFCKEAKKYFKGCDLMLFEFPMLFSLPILPLPEVVVFFCTLMCLTSEIDSDMSDGKLVFEYLMSFIQFTIDSQSG